MTPNKVDAQMESDVIIQEFDIETPASKFTVKDNDDIPMEVEDENPLLLTDQSPNKKSPSEKLVKSKQSYEYEEDFD